MILETHDKMLKAILPEGFTASKIVRMALAVSCAALTCAAPAAAQELLDLSRLGVFSLEAADVVPPRPRPPGRIEPAYARDMQRNVIVAMGKLTKAYIEATEDPAFVPEIVRDFAPGSGSPPAPTTGAGSGRKKLKIQNERFDFVRNQIVEGMYIWKISSQFFTKLYNQNDLSDEQIYINERQRIANQISAIEIASAQLKTGAELKAAAAEVTVWTNVLQQVEKRRRAEKAQFGQKLAEVKQESAALSKELQSLFTTAASKVQFPEPADFLATMSDEAVGGAFLPEVGATSGYEFLMGRSVKPSEGDLDTTVIDFVTKAKTTAVTVSSVNFGPADNEIRAGQALAARLVAAADRAAPPEPRPGQ